MTQSCRNSYIFTYTPNIRLYNFKNKTEFTNSIKKPLEKFVLYKSAKGFCLNTDCRNYDEHNSDSVLEIIIGDNDYHTGYSIYELGLAIAYKRNYPVRSCYLCKYHKSSYDIYADNRPIFCCLYKKLGMDKYCKSTKAWECNAFRADKVLCNDIIEKYNRSYTEVWEKERTSIRKI